MASEPEKLSSRVLEQTHLSLVNKWQRNPNKHRPDINPSKLAIYSRPESSLWAGEKTEKRSRSVCDLIGQMRAVA